MGKQKIIGFCGRKESGKSVLAKVCKDYGYEVTRFAEPLKQLISNLIYVKREELDGLKTTVKNYSFQDMDCRFIADETNIPTHFVKEVMKNKTFPTVRDLLQVIGTDLIRKYNPNWHVEKTFEYITSEENKDKNFVIDDVRFPNEVDMIRKMGGTYWFVVRPKVDNVSNHESENSLKWQDFDHIIINDKTLEYLEFNWRIFMENGYEASLESRNNILHKLHGNKELISEFINSNETFNVMDTMFISKHEFTYHAKYLNAKEPKPIIISSYNDNSVAVAYSKDSQCAEICNNPLMIEDLKMYI